jgi:uncharacterized membrane protein YkvA (DUF1232 family)
VNKTGSDPNLDHSAGFLSGLIRQARLGWRLFKDSRVPGWVKLIPVAGLVYLLSPIDLVPDLMIPGLGEIDDIALILLALKLFVDFSPPGIVSEHLETLAGKRGRPSPEVEPSEAETIDAPYRVLGPKDE